MDGFPPPVSPDIAARFFDIDDEASDFSADPPPQKKHKGPQPSTHFTDERAGEYAEEDNEGAGFKDKRTTDDEFCKTVEFVPVRSMVVDYLTCENIDEESEEETKKKKEDARAHVEKARSANAMPEFLKFSSETPGENSCLLCEIYLSELQGSEAATHPLLNAYTKLKKYDLLYCGFQAEPVIMQHCTSIFNQISGEYAIRSGTVPRLLTPKETKQHLYDHDVSNPKRPIVIATAEVKYLKKNLFNGCVGRTPSGRRVIRQANIGAYSTLVRLQTDLNSRFVEASAHVNNVDSGTEQRPRGPMGGQIIGRRKTKTLR